MERQCRSSNTLDRFEWDTRLEWVEGEAGIDSVKGNEKAGEVRCLASQLELVSQARRIGGFAVAAGSCLAAVRKGPVLTSAQIEQVHLRRGDRPQGIFTVSKDLIAIYSLSSSARLLGLRDRARIRGNDQ
jgi:hypothetical protein